MPHTDTIPVSASIASTGKGIRYIGDHAWATGGAISLSNTTQKTQLEFITGSGYIVGQFIFTGPTSETNPSGERDAIFRIQFNDQTVGYCQRLTGSSLIGTGETTINIIIPPLTKVHIGARSSGSDADYFTAVMFSGRVYGAV